MPAGPAKKRSARSTQATVDADQRAVDGCVLTAPIAGTVTAVNGSVGGTSSGSSSSGGSGGSGGSGSSSSSSSSSGSSSGFISLADLSALQADAAFAEADATKLKVGQPATISWSALSGASATGAVTAIAPTATTSNSVNTYAVSVSVDKVPDGARLGQTIEVKVTVASADNVLRVPLAAVRSAGNRYTVTVTKNGQNTVTPVEVGVKGDQYYEITSGLSEGDQVVVTTTVSTGSSTGTTLPGGGGIFGGGGTGGFGGRGTGGAGTGGGR